VSCLKSKSSFISLTNILSFGKN